MYYQCHINCVVGTAPAIKIMATKASYHGGMNAEQTIMH